MENIEDDSNDTKKSWLQHKNSNKQNLSCIYNILYSPFCLGMF